MPRFPRIHLDDAVYSIQMEGPSGEPIYKDAEDHEKYLSILSQAKNEFGFKLFSYALLPDRIHLLIEPVEEHPVSQIMQKITPNYTKYYNNKYGRKGHLFPKRFRSIYAERGLFLSRLTRYIHLLPQLAGHVSNFRDYPYSSYAAYNAATVPVDMSGEVKEVLSMIGTVFAENPYECFIFAADDHEIEFLEKKLSRGSFLGSEAFIAKVRREIALHAVKKEQETPAELAPVEAVLAASAPAVLEPVPAAAVSRGGWHVQKLVLSGILFTTLALNILPAVPERPAPTASNAPAVVTEPKAPATKVIARGTPFTFMAPIVGTIWEVELYTVTQDGTSKPIKDKIRFNGKSFESYYFSSQGFSPSNYTVSVRPNGAITWETIQRNRKGEVISWRGDLEDGRMEGVMNYQVSGKNSQNFSFLSNNDIVRIKNA